jgi:ketosteroid isomerase-like protein
MTDAIRQNPLDTMTASLPAAPPAREPDKQSDGAAIMDLVARFDDAVNRKDTDEFAMLWAEDAIWEICEPMAMHAQGRDTIVETWTKMIAGTEWLFRGSFIGVLDVTGDTATGRWPCIETGTFKATDTAPAWGYDNRALYEDRTSSGTAFGASSTAATSTSGSRTRSCRAAQSRLARRSGPHRSRNAKH